MNKQPSKQMEHALKNQSEKSKESLSQKMTKHHEHTKTNGTCTSETKTEKSKEPVSEK